jgi:hypothetical protein
MLSQCAKQALFFSEGQLQFFVYFQPFRCSARIAVVNLSRGRRIELPDENL